MAEPKQDVAGPKTQKPEAIHEPTAEERTWLTKLSQYRPWPKRHPRHDGCPLIPHRLTETGKREAVDHESEDRGVPYYLRGRGDEFNFLACRLVQKPSALTLVTGPPGTGKSALLNTVAEYTRRLGHVVVKLQPKDLANAATIAQKCRNAAMDAKDAPGRTDKSKAVQGGINLRAAAEKVFATMGVEVKLAVERSIHQSDIGDVDLIQHLRAVCHYKGKNRRLLILVDEAQDAEETATISAEHRNAIRNNLYILNDRLTVGEENLPVTTILAGLPPARENIRKFISRPASGCDLELTPVHTTYIRQILDDYLTIDVPCKIRPAYIPEEHLNQWSRECQGHVLLANQLGFKLQQHAIDHIQKGLPFQRDNKGKKFIPVLANFNDEIRNDYYIQQLPDDMSSPMADVVHHIMQASISNHDPNQPMSPHMQPSNIIHPITWDAAITLTRRALRSYPEDQTDEPVPTAPETLCWLQRKGIIRRMRPVPHFLRLHRKGPVVPEEHCAIPIPTITEYMQQQYAKLPETRRARIRRNVQQVMQDFPRDIGTQWQWGNVARRTPIPTIPGVDYEPTSEIVPLPQKTTGTIHLGSSTIKAITLHHDQWLLTRTEGESGHNQTIDYPELLQFIHDFEKKTKTRFQWPIETKESTEASQQSLPQHAQSENSRNVENEDKRELGTPTSA